MPDVLSSPSVQLLFAFLASRFCNILPLSNQSVVLDVYENVGSYTVGLYLPLLFSLPLSPSLYIPRSPSSPLHRSGYYYYLYENACGNTVCLYPLSLYLAISLSASDTIARSTRVGSTPFDRLYNYNLYVVSFLRFPKTHASYLQSAVLLQLLYVALGG